MFRIQPIKNGKDYINNIIKGMEQHAQKSREDIDKRWSNSNASKGKDTETITLDKRKDLELDKIRYINRNVNKDLRKVYKSFPRMTKISPIYKELLDTSSTPVEKLSEALTTVHWITQRCDELSMITERKIKYAKTHQTVGFLMKKYLGKVNSLFDKNSYSFKVLQDARFFLNSLPEFKELFTVTFMGFPNVGKSTLMKKVTGSDVEIQNYPFTTKGLMFGYITHNESRIVQIIDTPGLLGRNKQNSIEQRADLVLRNYSNASVFVLDVTESCGYQIESQIKLLKKFSMNDRPFLIYLSKTDIYTEEEEEKLEEIYKKISKYEVFRDYEDLKKRILELRINNMKNFDPTRVKVIS